LKLIGISQRIDYLKDRKETRESIDQKLNKLLVKCNLTPVPIPNIFYNKKIKDKGYGNLKKWVTKTKIKGIILSGGSDIGLNKERDNTEYFLIKYVKTKKLPLLGICRGMQIIAKSEGVSLKKITKHKKTYHKIYGKISGVVNSYHNLSIKKCPNNYIILAKTIDENIEAIKHKHYPIEGWMWHPERNKNFNKRDINKIKKIFRK